MNYIVFMKVIFKIVFFKSFKSHMIREFKVIIIYIIVIIKTCLFRPQSQTARLYTTGLMRVLLRAGVTGFSTWGIEALVAQLYDSSMLVAMEALSILSEACEDYVR